MNPEDDKQEDDFKIEKQHNMWNKHNLNQRRHKIDVMLMMRSLFERSYL